MARRNWITAPVVTIPVYRPACPGCDSASYTHVRGGDNGDDSSTEQVICSTCYLPFKIVREFQFPNGEIDFGDCG